MTKREETSLPNIEFTTATGRYDESRSPIDLIVLHSTAGTLQSTISLFGSAPQPGKETSAHYVIENDGELYQGLEEYFTAYHCGNLEKNRRSIGIEHVDNGPTVKRHTDAQYAMSAKLVKDICTFYNIPIDSSHIIPHSSVVATACPNGLDVARIIREASGSTPPTDDCLTKLTQVTQERDRLNKVIEGKDKEIEDLKNQNSTCNSSLASLTAEKNSLAVQLSECQKTSLVYKEAYDALPGIKDQVTELERQKQVWIDKEVQLGKEYKALQTRYLNLKKPGLKFMQDALIRLCEKMGVEL